jgi:hypothetical protein
LAVGAHGNRGLGTGAVMRAAGTDRAALGAVAIPLGEATTGCRAQHMNFH